MSLGKRNIGRRVAGVGAAVTLMVLGLQAPASAAITITALSPTSGPADCVVVATGTGFKDFPAAQMTVEFVTGGVGTAAADFFPISDTILWVTTPGLTAGSSYTLRVDNPGTTDPGISSTATFLATTGSGGCAPTITSFTPTCGVAGDVVVITGTNLIDGGLVGGEVAFSPYDNPDNIATHTLPDVDDVTSLSVIVPSGNSGAVFHPTADGPIRVTTDVGAAVFSATSFLVPPPDCTPDTGNDHARSITFKIKKSGAASGVVSSTEDPAFTDCAAVVPVKIQRKTSGGWKTVGKATTNDTGSYSKKVKNKPGKQKFRALAPKVSLGDPVTDVCLKAKSATRSA
jgi:hypothetical protein